VQNKKVVAVVKFEDENNKIQYQARYTNCYKKSEQKHAEDFFEQDIENGALREKVEVNPNGTIIMYFTIQPCNKSTSIEGRPNTAADKTCCKTLKNVFNDTLLPRKITLCVKATNLSRLSLIKEAKPNDETLREKHAVAGIEMLMGIGVKLSGMTQEDWHYLLSLTNELERNCEDLEVHEGRKDLDRSVQSIFDQIQLPAKLNQVKIDPA
jgi:hypothetical protein